jgi:hypothetical protein
MEAILKSGRTGAQMSMNQRYDEAFLVGQVASLIAVMSALVQALPPATRKRLLLQLTPQFESLIAAMRATEAPGVQTERKGAEWVRDLFLSQIANAEKTPRTRKKSPAPADVLDITL